MNYIILGAGAIGSYFGAILSINHDVLLIGRKDHVKAIRKDGLKITGEIKKKFKLKAKTELRNIPKKSVILLTTKVNDSKKSIRKIKKLLKKDTVIICLQNGIGIEDEVRSIVKTNVYRGITNQAVSFEKPGLIRTPFVGYAKFERGCEAVVDDLVECGIDAEISDNLLVDVWKKMLINCILNPLTAILDVSNNGIMDMQATMKAILEEVKLVLDKEGIAFTDKEYDEARTKYFSTNISSSLQDIRNGRKTEIDFLNGAIVKLGKKHNVATPINQMLVEMVKIKENKKRKK